MHRESLLARLQAYVPIDAADAAQRDRIAAFVRAHPDCFVRSLAVGHVTGSAWLLDPAGRRVLLTHHRKLQKWLQLGGHADGDPDVLQVALREAREESGLPDMAPVVEDIFDVDVHPIPAQGGVPAHDHYDVRFLLRAARAEPLRISDESVALAWFTQEEVPKLAVDESILRLHRKWCQRTWKTVENVPAPD
jgi:8-oxo-dGTP pyrophosphatase MutT (NUDIX family)